MKYFLRPRSYPSTFTVLFDEVELTPHMFTSHLVILWLLFRHVWTERAVARKERAVDCALANTLGIVTRSTKGTYLCSLQGSHTKVGQVVRMTAQEVVISQD